MDLPPITVIEEAEKNYSQAIEKIRHSDLSEEDKQVIIARLELFMNVVKAVRSRNVIS